jgi:hypothetical protein
MGYEGKLLVTNYHSSNTGVSIPSLSKEIASRVVQVLWFKLEVLNYSSSVRNDPSKLVWCSLLLASREEH